MNLLETLKKETTEPGTFYHTVSIPVIPDN